MTVPMPEFLEPADPDDADPDPDGEDGALFDLDQPPTSTPHL